MEISQDQKNKIIERAREIYVLTFKKNATEIQVPKDSMACLYHAAAVVMAAEEYGYRFVIQAGTAAWPRINMAEDDGVSATHFAHEYQGEAEAIAISNDMAVMPEMHIWAAYVDGQEIIDTSTRYLKTQCEEIGGIRWLANDPPDFLWKKCSDLPRYWKYEADISACFFAYTGALPAFEEIRKIQNLGVDV